MFGGNIIQSIIFFIRAAPHHLLLNFGLVPDLPIADIVVIAIRPAFGIMTNDMFANSRPFFIVRGREGAIRLDIGLIFNGNAKTIIWFHPCINQCRDQMIGENKIIVLRVGFICRKISEYVGHVNKATSAKYPANIV